VALIQTATLIPRIQLDVSDEIESLMPILLKDPVSALSEIHSIANSLSDKPIDPIQISKLTCSRSPIKIDHENIYQSDIEKTVAASIGDLIDALNDVNLSDMGRHSQRRSKAFYQRYLYQSVTRVSHLVSLLRKFNMYDGTILEIGSHFGLFAYPLQRLGYTVTAIDRYQDHKSAFDSHIRLMRAEGVKIIESLMETEAEHLASLGKFDAVISMAVIEHIPPSPKDFMEMLYSHVCEGGLLALDTPNIARYQNRANLAQGKSIFQDLKTVYTTVPPFAGHYREYTTAELSWLLEQVGCQDIETKLFDYNLFQFDELTGEHLENLLALPNQPDLSDTILAIGRADKVSSVC